MDRSTKRDSHTLSLCKELYPMVISTIQQEMPIHLKTWHGSLRFSLDRGKGTKVGFGANFENARTGSPTTWSARNGGDFYARSTDFDESTEIDRNQQFLDIMRLNWMATTSFQSLIEMIGA